MAKPGSPVEGSSGAVITLGQLADRFGEWLKREVEAGRSRPRALDYHRDQLLREIISHLVVYRLIRQVHQAEASFGSKAVEQLAASLGVSPASLHALSKFADTYEHDHVLEWSGKASRY